MFWRGPQGRNRAERGSSQQQQETELLVLQPQELNSANSLDALRKGHWTSYKNAYHTMISTM